MPSKTQTLSLALTQNLNYEERAPGVSAFVLTGSFAPQEDVAPWLKHALQEFKATGLAYTADIDRFLAGETQTLRANNQLMIASPEYLTQVQLYGYTSVENEKELLEALTHANKDPLAAPADWAVIRNEYSSHMLFNINDTPLPIGLMFSYMKGYVRNGAYDIDKLVAYLNEHPQVLPLKGSKHPRITSEVIPHYNAGPGSRTTASFVFSPTPEQMLQLWQKAQDLNKAYPSTVLHEAVFELDLLGLRAAGIARSDSYYGVDEDSDSVETD